MERGSSQHWGHFISHGFRDANMRKRHSLYSENNQQGVLSSDVSSKKQCFEKYAISRIRIHIPIFPRIRIRM